MFVCRRLYGKDVVCAFTELRGQNTQRKVMLALRMHAVQQVSSNAECKCKILPYCCDRFLNCLHGLFLSTNYGSIQFT